MKELMNNQAYVIKRNGKKETVRFEKIQNRIEKQVYKLDPNWINPFEVAKKVISGIYDGVTTRELDKLSAETAAMLTTKHPDYSTLAARLAVTALHKDTDKSFSRTVSNMYEYVNPETGKHAPLVSEEFNNIVQKNADQLDSAIVHSRDFNYDFFGFKTLEKSYLLKIDKEVAERPQYMIMRTAVGIHGEDIESAIETYESMSKGFFTHATPTLFNSGMPRPQLASCFLLQMQDDSIDGIFETLKEVAKISKNAGGIGIAASNIRATGSYITGTNGTSNGLIPFLKIFNETARAVDQGGGKRKGSFAIYLEPWHADVFEFLDLKKNHGKEELRARDLFYGMWMCDLFMQRVEKDETWSLMCPNECPGLQDVYAEDFVELYEKYESEGKYRKQVKARELWTKILEAQMETGTPYIAYKDSANVKSNQKNIGTLKTSNLCIEILEVVGPDETAVCNLASIGLPKHIKGVKHMKFDHQKLYETAYQATVNLNKVIDVTYYPSEKARKSNMKLRPIGLGTQGLADVFFKLDLPFDSEEAKQLNKEIYETIYFAALTASKDLAIKEGSYKGFKGSPISKGIFQFDMWNVEPTSRWNWEELREAVIEHGVRNSLTTCSMPTGSTSQILGNEAAQEAQTSNMYTRRVLSGEFIVVNKHLVNKLCELNLWDNDMKNVIIANNGSIQNIDLIPKDIRDIYKTVWEISQKDVIDQYAGRAPFIDQTQSMNIFMQEPNFAKLNSMHFYGWGNGVTKDTKASAKITEYESTIENLKTKLEVMPEDSDDFIINSNRLIELEKELDTLKASIKYGSTPEKALKTGIYYLRSQASADAVKFTVDNEAIERLKAKKLELDNSEKLVVDTEFDDTEEAANQLSCSLDNPDDCDYCSS